MTLQSQIRQHLDRTGLSQRALSIQAGINPKAVSDILNRPGHRPKQVTAKALCNAMGLAPSDPEPRMTYAQLISRLSVKTGDLVTDGRNRTLVSRLKKVIHVAKWVPELEYVDRARIIECFARWTPATLEISAGSFSTYKSDVLSAIEQGCGRNRKIGIVDVEGVFREIHEAIKTSDLPQDMKLISGSFMHYLAQNGVFPADITQDVLADYYSRRRQDGNKSEDVCKKHVKRIAALCSRLSEEPTFVQYQFPTVDHPFEDGRDKYRVPASALAKLLEEFDGPTTRWVSGEESREGLSYENFLAKLDEEHPKHTGDSKLALLKPKRNGRKKTEEERRSAGFLTESETWSPETIANRRGILIAGAKALYAGTGYLIESVEECKRCAAPTLTA